jgi:hypothetical protein
LGNALAANLFDISLAKFDQIMTNPRKKKSLLLTCTARAIVSADAMLMLQLRNPLRERPVSKGRDPILYNRSEHIDQKTYQQHEHNRCNTKSDAPPRRGMS